MAKIRVLAVEDDELYADTLRMVLDEIGYDLIQVIQNPREVKNLLRATQPDVVLMDIDLGEDMTGIDLVESINETFDLSVIYVTTYKNKEMIARAMATKPEGYITKPYEAGQMQAAIELALLRKQMDASPASLQPVTAPLKAIYVKEGQGLIKLILRDITMVEAYDKYCFVYTPGKKHLLAVQLKNLLLHLPGEQFLQVHRSYVINIEAIDKLKPQNNSIEVAGHEVPVSKTYKQHLYSKLRTI